MRGVSRIAAPVLTVMALVCATAPGAMAETNAPDGILKAKLGMTPEALEMVYPDAAPEPSPTPATAGEPLPPAKVARYTIKGGQAIGPLRDCVLGAAFFDEYLYQVMATCPAESAPIEAYLQQQYGPADYEQKPFKFWFKGPISVSYSSARRMFMVEDIARSQAASLARKNARRAVQSTARATPEASATPTAAAPGPGHP
jgi:hypothetical protein